MQFLWLNLQVTGRAGYTREGTGLWKGPALKPCKPGASGSSPVTEAQQRSQPHKVRGPRSVYCETVVQTDFSRLLCDSEDLESDHRACMGLPLLMQLPRLPGNMNANSTKHTFPGNSRWATTQSCSGLCSSTFGSGAK